MQQEGEEAARFLGEVLEGPLASHLEEVAFVDESCCRQKLVEGREQIRGKLLLRALELHPNRAARPVWSWPERDKHSSIWLLCLPFPDFTLTSQEFSTATAAMLCLPPPCCAPHIGKAVQVHLILKFEVMEVKVMCCASLNSSTHANHGIPGTLGQEMKSEQLRGGLKG